MFIIFKLFFLPKSSCLFQKLLKIGEGKVNQMQMWFIISFNLIYQI